MFQYINIKENILISTRNTAKVFVQNSEQIIPMKCTKVPKEYIHFSGKVKQQL